MLDCGHQQPERASDFASKSQPRSGPKEDSPQSLKKELSMLPTIQAGSLIDQQVLEARGRTGLSRSQQLMNYHAFICFCALGLRCQSVSCRTPKCDRNATCASASQRQCGSVPVAPTSNAPLAPGRAVVDCLPGLCRLRAPAGFCHFPCPSCRQGLTAWRYGCCSDYMLLMLTDVTGWLHEQNIPYFITYGTLLGAPQSSCF